MSNRDEWCDGPPTEPLSLPSWLGAPRATYHLTIRIATGPAAIASHREAERRRGLLAALSVLVEKESK